MAEDGDALPEPSGLEQVMAVREDRDGVAVLVPLEAMSGRAVHVDVTTPEDVLDRFAAERGMDRSWFLTRAARQAMEAEAPPAAA